MSGLRYESRLESRLNWLDGALSAYRDSVRGHEHAGWDTRRSPTSAWCGEPPPWSLLVGVDLQKTVSASESKPTNGARRAVIRARQVAERADTLHCPSNERRSFRQGSACIQERVAPFLGSSQKVSYLLAIAP